MTEIKYHSPRLSDEDELYEVYFTEGKNHTGSIFFKIYEDEHAVREVECSLHGTRDRKDYFSRASLKLIREKGIDTVYNSIGEEVAKLVYTGEEA